MKDSQYITHDIGARNDPKLVDLQMAMGGLGLGIWWCLVEMLWENEGYLPVNYRSLAYSLKWAKAKDVERVVTEFGLFESDGERFWNKSALERISHKRRISASRSVAGLASAEVRRNKSLTNVEQMLNNRSNGVRTAFEQEINKINNKDINNKSLSIESDNAEKRDIYRLFFFKNFKYPEKEVQRFLDRYEGNWCRTGSNVPERDHMRLARTWKPENTEPRFKDNGILAWLRRFSAWMAGQGVDTDAFLRAVVNISVDTSWVLMLVMSSTDWRDKVLATAQAMDGDTLTELTSPYKSLRVSCHG